MSAHHRRRRPAAQSWRRMSCDSRSRSCAASVSRYDHIPIIAVESRWPATQQPRQPGSRPPASYPYDAARCLQGRPDAGDGEPVVAARRRAGPAAAAPARRHRRRRCKAACRLRPVAGGLSAARPARADGQHAGGPGQRRCIGSSWAAAGPQRRAVGERRAGPLACGLPLLLGAASSRRRSRGLRPREQGCAGNARACMPADPPSGHILILQNTQDAGQEAPLAFPQLPSLSRDPIKEDSRKRAP